MSKKAKKSAPRAMPKLASKGPRKTATKGPASELNGDTAGRIANALEAIARHLSAAAPNTDASEQLGAADAFV